MCLECIDVEDFLLGGDMLKNRLNLYDFIKFPNSNIRVNLRENYKVFSKLKQISTDLIEKYDEKQVPCEFLDYQTTVLTWIKEYNYSVFILSIPLYQMLDVYQNIISNDTENEQLLYYLFIFNYYSELLAYYIDCAFKKSVNIFNEMFELKVNDDINSFMKILKGIQKESKSNNILNKVNQKLQQIKDSRYYQEIIDIRNRNTHSIRATQTGFLNKYDLKNGITFGIVNMLVKPEKIVLTILESIKLLEEYTVFIEKIIDEYYDSLYEKFIDNI